MIIINPTSMTTPYLRGRKLVATFDPADCDLYRRLVPEPLKMPDHPRVHVGIVRFEEVGWPLRHYNEAFISLAVDRGPTPGWHVTAMSVTTRLAMWLGRMLGFPKELADVRLSRIEGDEGDEGDEAEWSGFARKNGLTLLAMRFQGAEPVDRHVDIPSYYSGVPMFQLNPPGKGPSLMSVTLDMLSPLTFAGNRGTVTLAADPSLPWAGLLPEEATGEYLAWKGAYALRAGLTASHVLEVERTPVGV